MILIITDWKTKGQAISGGRKKKTPQEFIPGEEGVREVKGGLETIGFFGYPDRRGYYV